jgi:hypothetical protein
MTATACFSGFRGLQCPHYANDLCVMVVEPCLDISVNLIVNLSAVLFANELGTGTDFVGECSHYSSVLQRKRL